MLGLSTTLTVLSSRFAARASLDFSALAANTDISGPLERSSTAPRLAPVRFTAFWIAAEEIVLVSKSFHRTIRFMPHKTCAAQPQLCPWFDFTAQIGTVSSESELWFLSTSRMSVSYFWSGTSPRSRASNIVLPKTSSFDVFIVNETFFVSFSPGT